MAGSCLLRKFIITAQPHMRRHLSGAGNAALTSLAIDAQTKIATLTLQRPPANALSLALMQQIKRDIENVKSQPGCRGLILTSASERIFSAGLDLTEVYRSEPQRFAVFWTALQDLWHVLFSLPLPSLALINGHAVAGGCMMATCCDYRVMLPNFLIGLNETKAGVPPSKYVIDAYVNVMPSRRRAEGDLIVGHAYKSQEALAVGLIDALVPTKEAALEQAHKFFATYDGVSATAAATTKLQFRRDILEDFARDRRRDAEEAMRTLLGEEVQAHLGAYLQTFGKSRGKKKSE